MNKLVLSVVILALVQAAVGTHLPIQDVITTCQNSTYTAAVDIYQILLNGPKTSQDNCFFACIYKFFGIIDPSGKFNLAVTLAGSIQNRVLYWFGLLTGCSLVGYSGDVCTLGLQIFNCFQRIGYQLMSIEEAASLLH